MTQTEGSVSSHYTVYQSSSLDEARARANERFYPLRLDQVGRQGRFAMVMHVGRLGPLTVADVRYGADVTIDCGELTSAYHVNVPLSGYLESRYGRHDVTATPTCAALYGPHGDTVLKRWSLDCRQLCIKIERGALERELEELLGRAIRGPITIAPTMDLQGGAARSWLSLALLFASEIRRDDGLARQPLAAASLAHSLIAGLLVAADHAYHDELVAPQLPCRPPVVQRAIEIIECCADEPLTVAELARRTHVSVRALQEGFQRYVQMSPMAYLRTVRLRRAHEELERSHPSETTVALVASGWGFAHLSRFAATYRATYGVPPSQTLRAVPA